MFAGDKHAGEAWIKNGIIKAAMLLIAHGQLCWGELAPQALTSLDHVVTSWC
jgi:hypothetical protein